MSDYLARLIDRGRGGSAAAGLPLIRATSALFVVPPGGEAWGERVIETAAAPPPAAQETPDAPLRGGPAPATAAEFDPPPPAPPPLPPSDAKPRRPPASRVAPEERRAASEPAPAPSSPSPPSPPGTQGAPPASTPTRLEAAPGSPTQAALSPAPRSKRRPEAAPITLERIIERMFADEGEDSSTVAARRTPHAAAGLRAPLQTQVPAAPLVSIGRIDITVAEPPSRPAPRPRTRGFEAYTRLRRGLER